MLMKDQALHVAVISLIVMNPEPAIGAMFGMMFFIVMPFSAHWAQKIVLAFFSWGFGFSFGFSYNDANAMWISAVSAALSVVALSTVWQYMNGGDLPKWIDKVVDLLERFWK